MFEGREFPKALDEERFTRWLEKGRQSKIGYHYLLIVWSDHDSEYQPVYVQTREEISAHKNTPSGERLVAAYDLYSESRIL